ncbi:MAG: hypothetical protein ACKVTZ_13555, partial [Bacteroidia bacterium]
MDKLLKIKKQYIDLLQQHTSWGKNIETVDDSLDIFEKENSDLSAIRYNRTQILVNTNEIVSPIHLDTVIELPKAELFIDDANFVIYTTKGIYCCIESTLNIIEYKNIAKIDYDYSLTKFFRSNPKGFEIFDFRLIFSNGAYMEILLEYGVSWRPIVRFLSVVNDYL